MTASTAPIEPLARERRHPADYRDEIEHAEVAAVLSQLSYDHPARRAYLAAEASDSIALSHLIRDRPDLVKQLIDEYMGHHGRIWARYGGAGIVARQQRGKPA